MRSLGRRLAPGLLLLPGGAWLIAFFAVPMAFMLLISLQTGTFDTGYEMTWNFAIYPEVIGEYWDLYLRSFTFAILTTVIALAVEPTTARPGYATCGTERISSPIPPTTCRRISAGVLPRWTTVSCRSGTTTTYWPS